jgi:hypothetical protein
MAAIVPITSWASRNPSQGRKSQESGRRLGAAEAIAFIGIPPGGVPMYVEIAKA